MTRREALKSYTLDAAYAAFQESTRGSLSVGKAADIVVLSRNILTCDADKILDTKVDMTILDGQLRYERDSE